MSERLSLDHRFFEQYRYAIVDAGWREDIHDSWPVSPIAPSFLENDTARCPLLIDWRDVPEADRHALLNRLEAETNKREETLISLALSTSKPIKPLLQHLTQRLVIQRTADSSLQQFRYFDPGTFIQLPDVLGSAGISWLLGPIEKIAVPWLGEWCCFSNPQDAGGQPFDLHMHQDALQGFSVVNRVLTQIEDIRNQDDWRRKGEITREIIAHAQSAYGLDQRDDLVAFALHAWRQHPAFDRHRTLQKILAELATTTPDEELDYRELTARLDEADWQKIVQDLQVEGTLEGNKQ